MSTSKPKRFREAKEAVLTLKRAGLEQQLLTRLISTWCADDSDWSDEERDVTKRLQGWGIEGFESAAEKWIKNERAALKEELEKLIEPAKPFASQAAQSNDMLSLADASALLAVSVPGDRVEAALKPRWDKRKNELEQRLKDLNLGTTDEIKKWANEVVAAEMKQEEERRAAPKKQEEERRAAAVRQEEEKRAAAVRQAEEKREAARHLPPSLRGLKSELREQLVVLEELIQSYIASVNDGVPEAEECKKIAKRLIPHFDGAAFITPTNWPWDPVALVMSPNGGKWAAVPEFPGRVTEMLKAGDLPSPGIQFRLPDNTPNAHPIDRKALAAAAVGAQFVGVEMPHQTTLTSNLKTWSDDSKLPWKPELTGEVHSEVLKLLRINRAVMLYIWLVRRMLAQEEQALATQGRLLEIREKQVKADAPLIVKEVVKDFRTRLKAELDACLKASELQLKAKIEESKSNATSANEALFEKCRNTIEQDYCLKLNGHDAVRSELYWSYSVANKVIDSEQRLIERAVQEVGGEPPAAPLKNTFLAEVNQQLNSYPQPAAPNDENNQDPPDDENNQDPPDTAVQGQTNAGPPSAPQDTANVAINEALNNLAQEHDNLLPPQNRWARVESWCRARWRPYGAVLRELKRDLFEEQLAESGKAPTTPNKPFWKTPYDPANQGTVSLVWSLLKEAASMPMRIIAPVFGLFAFLMILGISNPLKQATKGLGEEVVTPPYFFSMFLAFLLLLGSCGGLLKLVWERQDSKITKHLKWKAPLWSLASSAFLVAVMAALDVPLDNGFWLVQWLLISAVVLNICALFLYRKRSLWQLLIAPGFLAAVCLGSVVEGISLGSFSREWTKLNSNLSEAALLIPAQGSNQDGAAPVSEEFQKKAMQILDAIKDKLDLAIEIATDNINTPRSTTIFEALRLAKKKAAVVDAVNEAKAPMESFISELKILNDSVEIERDLDAVRNKFAEAQKTVNAFKLKSDQNFVYRIRFLLVACAVLLLLSLTLHFHLTVAAPKLEAEGKVAKAKRDAAAPQEETEAKVAAAQAEAKKIIAATEAAVPSIGWPMTYFGTLATAAGLMWLPSHVIDEARLEHFKYFQKAADFAVQPAWFVLLVLFSVVLAFSSVLVAWKCRKRVAPGLRWLAASCAFIGAWLVYDGRSGLNAKLASLLNAEMEGIAGSIILGVVFILLLGLLMSHSMRTKAQEPEAIPLQWAKVALLMALGGVSWLWLNGLASKVFEESGKALLGFREDYFDKQPEGLKDDLKKELTALWRVGPQDGAPWPPPSLWWSDTSLGKVMMSRLVYEKPKEGKETSELPIYKEVFPSQAMWIYGGLLGVLVWGGVVVQNRRVSLFKAQKEANERDAREKLVEKAKIHLQKALGQSHDNLDRELKTTLEDNKRHAEAWLELKVLRFDVGEAAQYDQEKAKVDQTLAVIAERTGRIKTQEKLLQNLEKCVERTESVAVKIRETVRKDSLL